MKCLPHSKADKPRKFIKQLKPVQSKSNTQAIMLIVDPSRADDLEKPRKNAISTGAKLNLLNIHERWIFNQLNNKNKMRWSEARRPHKIPFSDTRNKNYFKYKKFSPSKGKSIVTKQESVCVGGRHSIPATEKGIVGKCIQMSPRKRAKLPGARRNAARREHGDLENEPACRSSSSSPSLPSSVLSYWQR